MSITFSHIVAMDENRLIGRNNELPWHLPSDLAYFKRVTMGKPVVMGRKTHQSIGRPLPGRLNFVLSRDRSFRADGCVTIHRLEEVNDHVREGEVMIIGGANVYEQTLPMIDTLYITRIRASFEGDAYYPEWDEREWQVVQRTEGTVDEKNKYPHEYIIMKRIVK